MGLLVLPVVTDIGRSALRGDASRAAPPRSLASSRALATSLEESRAHHELDHPEGRPWGEKEGKHEEEKEGEEDDWEQEQEFDDVDTAMALMLFCCLSTNMVLFYMVNWKDDDIRRYSWQIINSTISIFVAVMIFTGIDEYITSFIPVHDKNGATLASYALFLFLFTSLQVCIMVLSGANCEGNMGAIEMKKEVWCCADILRCNYLSEVDEAAVRDPNSKKSVAIVGGVEVFVEKMFKSKQEREQRVKAYATLFEHMSGFAAINMGGWLQNYLWFKQNWFTSALAVVVNQILLFLLFRLSKVFRDRMGEMDGVKDDRDAMYEDEVYEAENNISSLAASFQIVQVVRFALSGQLPEISGEEEGESDKQFWEIGGLYIFGVIFGAGAVLVLMNFERMEHRFPSMKRQLEMIESTCGMVAAWSIFWATRWTVASSGVLFFLAADGGADAMGAHVLIALALSTFSLFMIRCLDILEDAGKGSGHGAKGMDLDHLESVTKSGIGALGILVGFSWERCFDQGVATLSSMTEKPNLARLCGAVLVAIVIVPAWSKYIVSKVLAHRRWHKAVTHSTFGGGDMGRRLSFLDDNDGEGIGLME